MTMSLFDATAAGEEAAQYAELAANRQWVRAAERYIMDLEPGETFIAEDICMALDRDGVTTTDTRAIGAIVKRFASRRVIARTGNLRPARTSHGSYKPEWCRR